MSGVYGGACRPQPAARWRLASITDVLGLTSAFAYGANDFVRSLTTPYGTTSFRHEVAANSNLQRFIPDLGRWLSPDPIGPEGGNNLYVHVFNDPINFIDRTACLATRLAHPRQQAISSRC